MSTVLAQLDVAAVVFMTVNVPIQPAVPFVSTTSVLLQLVILDALFNLIASETATAHSVPQESVLHSVMELAPPIVTAEETSMDVELASMAFANHPDVVTNAFLVLTILAMVSTVALTVIHPPPLQILVPSENHVTLPALLTTIVIKLEHVLFVPMDSVSVIMLDVEPPVSLEMMDLVLPPPVPIVIQLLEILAPRVILVALLAH